MTNSLAANYEIKHPYNLLGRVLTHNQLKKRATVFIEQKNTSTSTGKISAEKITKKIKIEIISTLQKQFSQSHQYARALLPQLKPYLCQHHELFFLVDVLFHNLRDLTLSALFKREVEPQVIDRVQNCLMEAGETMIRLALEDLSASLNPLQQRNTWRLHILNLVNEINRLLEEQECSVHELKLFTQTMECYLKEECYLSLASPLIVLYHPNCADRQTWKGALEKEEEPNYAVPMPIRELSNTGNLSIRYGIESFDQLCQKLSCFVSKNSENETWLAICKQFEMSRAARLYSKQQLLDPQQISVWLPDFRARFLGALDKLNRMSWIDELKECKDIKQSLTQLSEELNSSFCNQRETIEENKKSGLEHAFIQPLEDLHLCYLIARHLTSGHIRRLINICEIFSAHCVAVQELLKNKKELQTWTESLYQPKPLMSVHFLKVSQGPPSLEEWEEWEAIGKTKKTVSSNKPSQRLNFTPKPTAKKSKPLKKESLQTSALLKLASPKRAAIKNSPPPASQTLSKRLLTVQHQNPAACSRYRRDAFKNLVWLTHQIESLTASKFRSLDALPPYVSLSMAAATVGWAIEQTYTMQLPPEVTVNHDLLSMHSLTYPKTNPSALVQQLAPINHWMRFWNENYEQHLFSNQSTIQTETLQLLQELNEAGLTLLEQQPVPLKSSAQQLLQDGIAYLHSLLDPILKEMPGEPDEFGSLAEPIHPLAYSLEELAQWIGLATSVAKTARKNYGLITQQKARQLVAMQLSVQRLIEQMPQQTTIYQVITSASWVLHWTHEIAAESLALLIYERSGHYESRRQLNYLVKQVPDLQLDALVKQLNHVHNKVRYPSSYTSDSIATQLIDNLHLLICAPELEQGYTLVSRNSEQKESLTLHAIAQQLDRLIADALQQIRSIVLSQINVLSFQKESQAKSSI